MMRLFRAIWNLFRKILGMAAEKIEDPEAEGKFAIEDSEDQIDDVKVKLAKLIASRKSMERKLAQKEPNINKWQGIAERAASGGDRESARQALEKKNSAMAEVRTLRTQLDKTSNVISNLKAKVNNAENKIEGARSNLTQLSARREGARLTKDLNNAAKGLGGGALSRLDDFEDKVDCEESEAEAFEELSTDPSQELEDKYGTSGSDVNAELDALMGVKKETQ